MSDKRGATPEQDVSSHLRCDRGGEGPSLGSGRGYRRRRPWNHHVLGFMAVNGELAKLDLDHMLPSEVFTSAASAFLNAVGASTGPLYATAFRRAAQALKEDERLSTADQAAIVEAMTAGIRERGKGQRGDKTMLDAWIPATEAAVNARARAAGSLEMWTSILEAAEAGANSTRSMVATRGRAARLGERSLGHIDPGAASAVIILRAMKETFASER